MKLGRKSDYDVSPFDGSTNTTAPDPEYHRLMNERREHPNCLCARRWVALRVPFFGWIRLSDIPPRSELLRTVTTYELCGMLVAEHI